MRFRSRRTVVLASVGLGLGLAALVVATTAISGVSHRVSTKSLISGAMAHARDRTAAAAHKSVGTRARAARHGRLRGLSVTALPQTVLDQAAELGAPPASVPDGARPGQPMIDGAKLVLSGVGLHKAALYAIPTSKGEVCGIYSTAYGTLGCAALPAAGEPINWGVGDLDALGSGDPPFVEGFAPPDVTSIRVISGSSSWPADLANGAFFFQLPQANAWPDGLEVKRSDGTTQRVSIHPPPVAIP